jgi:V/A-type H+/Na+-transporting ATPase subunit E
MTMSAPEATGVQALLDQLRDEGVQAGKKEADRLVHEAKAQAAKITAEAKAQADELLAKTQAQIKADRASAEEALKLATRDTLVQLESQVMDRFKDYVRRLVGEEMKDKDLLRRLILAVAGKAGQHLPPDAAAEVLLSAGPAEEKDRKAGEAELRQLLAGLSSDMLREGIELKTAEGGKGIRVKLKGKEIEIDLTEQAVAGYLLQNILPKYKKLLA